jgi:molybdate transport system regulatory protein
MARIKGAKLFHVSTLCMIFHGEQAVHGKSLCAGVARLMHYVDELHSLRAATVKMKMAYSKAWILIKEVEQGLQVELLNRNGVYGSTLTPEGQKFLKAYDQINDEVAAFANKRFKELMGV